jgi:hypothetical protein
MKIKPRRRGVSLWSTLEGSPLMVLHALTPGAKVVMTVLLEGKLYVFDVASGPDPDLAVTYVLTDPRVRRGEEVTEEDVRANRLRLRPGIVSWVLAPGDGRGADGEE